MDLSLGKFKKVKEDDKTATLVHPDGHRIQIAKNSLNLKNRQQLKKLPLSLAEGSEEPVQDESTPQSNQPAVNININGQAPQQPMTPISVEPPAYDADKAKYNLLQNSQLNDAVKEEVAKKAGLDMTADQINQAVPQTLGRMPADVAPEASPMLPPQLEQTPEVAPPTPAAPQAGSAMAAAPGASSLDPIGQWRSGLEAEAQAQGQLGQDQMAAIQKGADAQQAAFGNYQKEFQTINQERDALQNDINNHHIDPNRLVSGMGFTSKVGTAIGLILGGIGAGMTHTQNAALAVFQHNIDKDIEAQRNELGKKENLLSANLRQYGNLRDAMEMTRLQLSDTVKNGLLMAAAKSQDPIAKARAQQAAAQLTMTWEPVAQQLARRRAFLQGGGSSTSQQDPSMLIRALLPEKDQAPALKELGQTQEQTKAQDAALDAFDQLNKINTLSNRVTSPLQTPKQASALRNNLAVQLARAAAGRVNEYEFQAAKELFPSPGDSEETVKMKRSSLVKFLQEKMQHPVLDSYGIQPGVGKYSGNMGERTLKLGPPVQ